MNRVFRNIRQKLLVENRVTRYLLYALGEIVLVVIGILIALQVNNWNENRKNKITEQSYVKSLINDLEKDTSDLRIAIKLNKNKILGLDSLLTLKNKDLQLQVNNDQLYLLFGKYLSIPFSFTNNNTALAQITNSDALTFFRKQVADSITSFQQNFIGIEGQTEAYEKIHFDLSYKAFAYLDFATILDSTYIYQGKWTGKHFPPVLKNQQLRMEFFNYTAATRGITNYYLYQHLQPQLERTRKFITYLEKTYHILK